MEGTWKGRAIWVLLAVAGVAMCGYGAHLMTSSDGDDGRLVFGLVMFGLGFYNSLSAGRLADFMWTGRA